MESETTDDSFKIFCYDRSLLLLLMVILEHAWMTTMKNRTTVEKNPGEK